MDLLILWKWPCSVSKLPTQAKIAEIWSLVLNKFELFETGLELRCVEACIGQEMRRLVNSPMLDQALDPTVYTTRQTQQQADALGCANGSHHEKITFLSAAAVALKTLLS